MRSLWSWPPHLVHVLVLVALVAGLGAWAHARGDAASAGSAAGPVPFTAPTSSAPPSRDGYFETLPTGAWKTLPSDATCERRIRRSSWEPRPTNALANNFRPDQAAVDASFDARPRGNGRNYDPLFNSWLLPRVNGHHAGTTDENIQWAACKWGISDNVLRAMAAAESTWYQGLRAPDGTCVQQRGCGDMVESATADSRTYCDHVAGFGRDYQGDYGEGICPKTFSIIGVMSWQDPDWGQMPGNQNGTFPFNRDSTAFALDYAAAHQRGCMEGWVTWLDARGDFDRGDLWGCVGVWFGGDWKIPASVQYAERVKSLLDERFWLRPDFADPLTPGGR